MALEKDRAQKTAQRQQEKKVANDQKKAFRDQTQVLSESKVRTNSQMASHWLHGIGF